MGEVSLEVEVWTGECARGRMKQANVPMDVPSETLDLVDDCRSHVVRYEVEVNQTILACTTIILLSLALS